jgi:hypothetical protein
MAFIICPEAKDNFNKKGEELLQMLVNGNLDTKKPTFPSQRPAGYTISAHEIIGEIKHGETDFKGDEVSQYFEYNGNLIGLNEEKYIAFERLCFNIQKNPSIRDVISLRVIKDEVFEWIKLRYKNQTIQSLLDFILPRLESIIRDIEIWIPIFGMEIESSFQVGRVLFQPITKSLIDKWYVEVTKGRSEEEISKLKKYFEKKQKQIQGLAAGTQVLKSEPERASEIALQEIERMLSIVRFFEPSNFHPTISSHCTILGKQNLQTIVLFFVENSILVESRERIIDKGEPYWRIDKNLLTIMKKTAIDKLNIFLTSEKLSEFQTLVIDSLQTYSRVGLAKTYSDKLVYLLVVLESLLLKDSSEPIQQNVGERLAFALDKLPENRKRIVKNFKDTYGMRSEFLHHGNDVDIEKINTLREFMMNVWHFLSIVIGNANNFRTKLEMINAIENIKFS